MTTRLGVDWDLRANTYKPFPCGIVNHPTIDGAIQLHDEFHPVAGSDRRRSPACRAARPRSLQPAEHHERASGQVLRLSRRGRRARPRQGRHSGIHGRGGQRPGGEACARACDALRATLASPKTRRTSKSSWPTGERSRSFVEASLGNLARPLSDRQLDAKFRDQAVLALPSPQVEEMLASCWRIDTLDDVGEASWTRTVPRAVAVLVAACGGRRSRPTTDRVFNKAAWRVLPVLTLAYVFNYLDRNNIGFRGADDEPRDRADGHAIRPRRGHAVCRLLLSRSAEQHGPLSRRRAACGSRES